MDSAAVLLFSAVLCFWPASPAAGFPLLSGRRNECMSAVERAAVWREGEGDGGLMTSEIRRMAQAPETAAWMLRLRRELHEFPELANEEFRTSTVVRHELDCIGVAYSGRLPAPTSSFSRWHGAVRSMV
ncbi:IAA-amino acid hydrolase ILR1-like 6 [Zingiber officinale]|uniref:IAA-amino acid hydrolase ILR1-like 6 n=1 Tax=Zingiber officinale TaxID=94328 RepID=UPI001C4CDDC8|nr:IAA-amino acid hydrolase ILR1-like 6 [Zingiber officinale]